MCLFFIYFVIISIFFLSIKHVNMYVHLLCQNAVQNIDEKESSEASTMMIAPGPVFWCFGCLYSMAPRSSYTQSHWCCKHHILPPSSKQVWMWEWGCKHLALSPGQLCTLWGKITKLDGCFFKKKNVCSNISHITTVSTTWGIQFPLSSDVPQQFERERPSISCLQCRVYHNLRGQILTLTNLCSEFKISELHSLKCWS